MMRLIHRDILFPCKEVAATVLQQSVVAAAAVGEVVEPSHMPETPFPCNSESSCGLFCNVLSSSPSERNLCGKYHTPHT